MAIARPNPTCQGPKRALAGDSTGTLASKDRINPKTDKLGMPALQVVFATSHKLIRSLTVLYRLTPNACRDGTDLYQNLN